MKELRPTVFRELVFDFGPNRRASYGNPLHDPVGFVPPFCRVEEKQFTDAPFMVAGDDADDFRGVVWNRPGEENGVGPI